MSEVQGPWDVSTGRAVGMPERVHCSPLPRHDCSCQWRLQPGSRRQRLRALLRRCAPTHRRCMENSPSVRTSHYSEAWGVLRSFHLQSLREKPALLHQRPQCCIVCSFCMPWHPRPVRSLCLPRLRLLHAVCILLTKPFHLLQQQVVLHLRPQLPSWTPLAPCACILSIGGSSSRLCCRRVSAFGRQVPRATSQLHQGRNCMGCKCLASRLVWVDS